MRNSRAASLIAVCMLFFAACMQGNFSAQPRTGTGRGQSNDAGQGARADGGKRPTDQDEGLEGYLVDPRDVRLEDEGDDTRVTARSGSVEASRGSPADVDVGVWQVTEPLEEAAVSAVSLACGRAEADGSFSFKVRTPRRGDIVVSVGVPCRGDVLWLNRRSPRGTTTVARAGADGRFEDARPRRFSDASTGTGSSLGTSTYTGTSPNTFSSPQTFTRTGTSTGT